MNRRSRTLAIVFLSAACALAGAAPAGALTKHSHLRVEARGGALESDSHYSNGGIRTQNSRACGERDSRFEKLSGANAMGIVGHAAEWNTALAPFRTSDTFSFGLIVCRIGDFAAFDVDHAWLYKVNHEFASVGADQLAVGRDDEVLWYFANFATGRNTGAELELQGVPGQVDPNEAFQVSAKAFDGNGTQSDAEGVTVTGGAAPATSGADGSAALVAPGDEGVITLRGTRDDDIPSAPVEVCVNDQPAACPPIREDYYGTARGDLIRGTDAPDRVKPSAGPDEVTTGGGDDLVYARDGLRDDITCGDGQDVVKTTIGEDEVASDCEVERLP